MADIELVDLYVLRCPDTGDIRYAGKANNAPKRLASHIRDARCNNRPVCKWITSLVARGVYPVMEVVKRVPKDSWEREEIALIAQLRSDPNNRMLNLADGGATPSNTLEQRKLSAKKNLNTVPRRPRTDREKRINYLKIQLGLYLRRGEKNERYYATVEKLKLAAKKAPHLFGAWANL